MVLSFIIFVGFLIFLLIYLNPTKTSRINKVFLDATEDAILDEILIKYNEVGLKIEAAPSGGNCKEIIQNIFLNLGETMISKDVTEEDDKEKFYYLYFGGEKIFNGKKIECNGNWNYMVGPILEKDAVYNKNLVNLIGEYDNYENLKKKLEISNDFAFKVMNGETGQILKIGEEEIKGEKNIPQGANILARNIYINMIDENADIIPIIINIQVW